VNHDPEHPGSEETTDETGPEAPEAGDASGDDGEATEQLNLPLEALLDWGAGPVSVVVEGDEQLEAEAAEALIAAERDEYLDSLRRLQADFDNFRKRSMRQQTELLEHATEGLCVRLLPVLDALDLATAHLRGQPESTDAGKALEQIDSLLRDILAREGLERIDAVGVPFDPTIHDAVGQVAPEPPPGPEPAPVSAASPGAATVAQGQWAPRPASAAKGPAQTAKAPAQATGPAQTAKATAQAAGPRVAQVMRAGYRMRSKVLRPAMVLVGD
jgi:molecular chaperone GrpE